MNNKIDERLKEISTFVRDGAFLCDVGTDHAYLPCYLFEKGKISGCIATDISAPSLEKAKTNINKANLSDKISTCLTDGLKGLEGVCITDVVVAGMGGENIVDIIENSPSITKKQGVRLILQPMSMQYVLREYLSCNGFSVVDESIVKAAGKIYQIICAEFTGKNTLMSTFEKYFGSVIFKKYLLSERENKKLFLEYLERIMSVTQTKKDGKLIAGIDTSEEEEIIEKTKELISNVL